MNKTENKGKYVSSLLTNNWHYISHEKLNFKRGINFMTGKTGAGKSTVMDAMQLVVLGDTRGRFFNKAASSKSKRKLIEYLKGMYGNSATLGKQYKRNGDFSSHLCMEVAQSDGTFKTFGVVFDVRENDFKWVFFISEETIPENNFISDNGIPYSISDFKIKYKNENYTFYDNANRYQSAFLNVMGIHNKNFFDITKKSVSFQMDLDIPNFMRHFIIPERIIDIEPFISELETYNRLNKNLKMDREKKDKLSYIKAIHEEYSKHKDELDNFTFFKVQKKINVFEGKNLTDQETITSNKKEISILEEKRKEYSKRNEIIDDKIRIKKNELENSDAALRLKNLNSELKLIEKELNNLETHKKSIDLFEDLFQNNNKILSPFGALFEGVELAKVIEQKLRTVESNKMSVIEESSLFKEELITYKKHLIDIKGKASSQASEMESTIKAQKDELQKNKKMISNLENNVSNFDPVVVDFKNKLNEKGVSSNIFSDLLEIKDEEWRDAVEGYLGRQKQYIIVDEKDFETAYSIFERENKKTKHRIKVVDIKNVKIFTKKPMSNSLYEAVESDDENASWYAKYLLGSVIKTYNIEDMRKHKKAVTPDCNVYSNFTVGALNFKYYKGSEVFIGRIAKERQLKKLKIMNQELTEKIRSLSDKTQEMKTVAQVGVFRDMQIDQLIEAREKVSNEKNIIENKSEIEQQIKNVVLDDALKEEINRLVVVRRKGRDEYENCITQKSKKEEKNFNLQETISKRENMLSSLHSELNNNYTEEELEDYRRKFTKEISILSEEQMNNKTESHRMEKGKHWKRLQDKRIDFVNSYSVRLNISDNSNEEWDKYERELEVDEERENRLLEMGIRLKKRLESDVLSKLSGYIAEAHESIRKKNRVLRKFNFGKDTYRFDIKPSRDPNKKAIYKFITDERISKDENLFSDELRRENEEIVKQIYNLIHVPENADEETRRDKQKEAEDFLDYRNFLEYDIEVDNGETVSSLNATINKNSGGETQNPLYIALLASFADVYQLNGRHDGDTFRLVMFDEAFNNMDEERIKMCLDLIRSLNLQAFIVAPDKQLQSMGTLAERTFLVTNSNQNIDIKTFGREQLIEHFEEVEYD